MRPYLRMLRQIMLPSFSRQHNLVRYRIGDIFEYARAYGADLQHLPGVI